MNLSNRDFDRADELAERERKTGIEIASRALMASGAINCVECDETIEPQRRAALPSATRCAFCQTRHEIKLRGR